MSKIFDTDWSKKLGGDIKKAREDAGYTQRDLAKEAKTSRQTISKYEKEGVPFLEIFARIAAELDKPFKVGDLVITVERISPRLRTVPKQFRLDFEKSQTFPDAVISITAKEGQILFNAKIPA